MPHHEHEDERQQGKHPRLIFVGRGRIELLLDVHGQSHDDRPDADIEKTGNRQMRDYRKRQRIGCRKVFNPADKRRMTDFDGNI